MAKIEIELTEEQLKKVEILQNNDIDVGSAIDMLFEIKEKSSLKEAEYLNSKLDQANKEREELQNKLEEVNREISLYSQLKDTSLDVDQKLKILEKDYGEVDESYEMKVQDVKHNINWTRKFFKF
ncbi:MAG: hypothetical protein J6B73_02710 [Methanobrevibacter sp.]|uniref:hypothetical protein n=1 Tax=Methanobrevibacter sp. TaxID=66852 RepID=UPI001B172443|nr:hypothetical protein [Methanobrevibacter sp.]MBO5151065.1 hypothetical protein [Methanobrevibacter sp.]